MATYPFLSDEWVTEAHKLREEFEGKGGAAPPLVKMNLVITDVPFGPGTIDAHLDTSGGSLELDFGHVDPADLKVTVDYATAKSILVDGNSQAAMQAFMAGKIKVDGDIAKLMMWGSMPADPNGRSRRACAP
jgi:hypothetical protein